MNLLRRSSVYWLLPVLGLLGSIGVRLVAKDSVSPEPVAAVAGSGEKNGAAGREAPTKTPALPVKRAAIPQPRVLTDKVDHRGQQVSVSCATCHTTRAADYQAGVTSMPTEFHPGLVYTHGGLSCLSCHNADDYDTLRKADGQAVPYQNALLLCGQCHGPQTRDYRNGSHGGMVGYWDKTKGERDRNVCTDCHDVHAPAYPQMMPIFPPRDRGALEQATRKAAEALISNSAPHSHD